MSYATFQSSKRRIREAIKTEKSESAERLGSKLKVITNSFRRIADESTHELGITGMQSFLLGFLHCARGEAPCQRDIESRFNIKHPTATGLLQRLEDKGFVEFHPDKYDGRLKRIVITEAGRAAAEQTKRRLDDMDDRLTAGLTPEELCELHRLLDKLVENARQAAGCRRQEGEQ